jgi:hypothetical protein
MGQTEILAQESYGELLGLLGWFSLHGSIPVLIGGWAVFAYNSCARTLVKFFDGEY